MSVVAVIGAGTIGKSVALALAETGHNVILHDRSVDILSMAVSEIDNKHRLSYLFKQDKSSYDKDIVKKIEITAELSDIKKAEYLIENITENVEEKIELYANINKLNVDFKVVMLNTSCISITKLASYFKSPEKVIGVHFMNPVNQIHSVEIIKGFHTSEQTIKETGIFMSCINKEAIFVEDLPGFVSNRISHIMINEAAFILQDGVAKVEDIDRIFKKCYGHKMGPLETADLIGLETVVHSLDVLFESYQDTKFRCCPLLRKMADAGLYGQKSGKGFYNYQSA